MTAPPVDTVAIIGMAGRFPGAPTLEQFWDNLVAGRRSLSRFSTEELTSAGVSAAEQANPLYVPVRGVIEDPELFDADFFGISVREAEITDPQHRIALECAWQALEDAGYNPARFAGGIGVFAGASVNSYMLHYLLTQPELIDALGMLAIVLGNEKDHLATRIAYRMGLRGPALTVQTGCSTSLVAVHLARQSLLAGESDIAIAGGVCVAVPQETGYVYDQHGIASPDGYCRAFDKDAHGTVAGNGVGFVVLKRTRDALADGDTIRAIIAGSAMNNDGNAKVGYTAPSIEGQAAVIRRALEVARVDPADISYVEAHGTATEMGDAIEVAALIEAFRGQRDRTDPCFIGGVKPNIGHLDSAAGIAGLVKVTLALQHRTLPASIDCAEPNPQIPFHEGPFAVNTTTRDWPAPPGPRRAGVSSFGMGGTNVHMVVQEATAPARPRVDVQFPLLLPVSARDEATLDRATHQLCDRLRTESDLDPASVARTLHIGRAVHRHRRAIVWGGGSSFVAGVPRRASTRPTVAFLFPGQGSQYAGMATGLREHFGDFREVYDECVAALGISEAELSGPDIDLTSFAQPALFAVEFALAHLLRTWDIEPQLMLGHSIGEYVAVTLAGGMALPEALQLVSARGQLMALAQPGAMLAVATDEDRLSTLIPSGLDVAAINSPTSTVLSGTKQAIGEAERGLLDSGIRFRRLTVSHAFHSALMEPILDKFAAKAAAVTYRPLRSPVVSNVTGEVLPAGTVLSPEYWVRHLRGTVRFHAGVRQLGTGRNPVLVEVGPGHTLTSLASQCPELTESARITTLPGRDESGGTDDVTAFLGGVGAIWATGAGIRWPEYPGAARIPLPTYPFDRRRHWIDRAALAPSASAPAPAMVDDARPRQAVSDIWVSLLGGQAPAMTDNFFDCGGESLIAVRMLARIRLRLKVEVSIDAFLNDPTFGGLAASVIRAAAMKGQ